MSAEFQSVHIVQVVPEGLNRYSRSAAHASRDGEFACERVGGNAKRGNHQHFSDVRPALGVDPGS